MTRTRDRSKASPTGSFPGVTNPTRPSTPLAAVATAVSLVAYVGLVIVDRGHDTLRDGVVETTIGWYFLAFAGFIAAVWANEHRPFDRRLLWLAPIVFRLLMLTTDPTLSDDVYRYVWDGHLVAEGVNPYAYRIAAPELDALEIPARRMANNTFLSSPYLPVANGLFGLADLAGPSPKVLQLMMTGFDLATAAALSGLLTLAKLPRRRVLLYLWNPLIIVETAHGAHLDAAMAFGVVVALWAAMARPQASRLGPAAIAWLSPIALAAATLTRPIPLLLLPVLWWRWRWSHRVLYGAIVVATVVPFSMGPNGWGLGDATNGAGVFGSARAYSQDFRFNAGIYPWLESMFGSNSVGATGFVGLAMAAIGASVWWSARRSPYGDVALDNRRLLRLAVIPVAAYVLLTPVLHPWYLILLLALLVTVPPTRPEAADRWLLPAPWYWLAATVYLSYLTYDDPTAFAERDWVGVVEWFPTIAGLIITGFWVFFATQAEPPLPEQAAQPSVPAGSVDGTGMR